MQFTNGIGFKSLKLRQHIKSLFANSLYRNSIYLMLNSAVQALLGFVFWILVARLCTAEAVGLASAALSAISLLSLLATFGLGMGLIRNLPAAGVDTKSLINSVFSVNAISAVFISAIFIAGLGIWSPSLQFIRDQPTYMLSFIVFTVATCLAGISPNAYIAGKRSEFALIQSSIFMITKIILVVLLAQFFAAFGIFSAVGIGYLIAVSVGVLILLPRIVKDYFPLPVIRIDLLKSILKYSSLNYVADIFVAAPALVLPIIIINVLGAEQTAYFFITWNIASLMYAIGSATSLSIFAEGANNGEVTSGHIWQSLKFIWILLIPAILLLILQGDQLLLIFGKAYSEEGKQLLIILALSAVPLSINSIYFSKKKVERDMKPVIYFAGLIAALTLGLSYLLLPEFGLIYAGIAWLASQSLAALIILLIFLKNKLPKHNA
jgi:O-antigen/teichoic acid export membrane protein